jgi:putative membrane protein
MTRWLLSASHLLALGIGLGAVWARARALRRLAAGASLRPVFTADNWWVLALTLWLVTGLARALGGFEKPPQYYLYSYLFWSKMVLVSALYIVEMWPMATLIQWGIWKGKGREIDTSAAARMASLSQVQTVLLLAILLIATAMARGMGVAA